MVWCDQTEGKKAVLTVDYESWSDLGTGRAGRAQGAQKSCIQVRRRKQAGVESLTARTVDMFACPVCADPAAVSAQLRLC